MLYDIFCIYKTLFPISTIISELFILKLIVSFSFFNWRACRLYDLSNMFTNTHTHKHTHTHTYIYIYDSTHRENGFWSDEHQALFDSKEVYLP